jgi:hypothetical protein
MAVAYAVEGDAAEVERLLAQLARAALARAQAWEAAHVRVGW